MGELPKYYIEIYLAIIYVLIAISILFIYIGGISPLKTEYDIGEGIRKQYAPFFMEKERGEHRAYKKYLESSSYNFKIANIILVVCLLIIVVSYLIYIVYLVVINLDSYHGLLTKLLPDNKNLLTIAHVTFITALLIMFILVIVYTAKSYTRTCDHLASHEKEMLHKQAQVVSVTLGIISIVTVFYISNSKEMFLLFVTYVILGAILLLLIQILIEFREKITTNYESYKKDLCVEINKNTPTLNNEIDKNILKETDEPVLCPEKKKEDCCGIYKDSYKYLMHVINDHDITSISIPQQLKVVFKPTYLGGENIIHLKRALIRMYIHFDELSTSTTPNATDSLHPDKINETIRKELFDPKFKKYLTAEVECVITDGCGNKGDNADKNESEKQRYINLFKTHVINNTIFKKGDPLTNVMRGHMKEQRQSSIMKDAIFKYYNIINTFVTLIIGAILFFVYMLLMSKDESGIKLQIFAIAIVLLVILSSIINWFIRVTSI